MNNAFPLLDLPPSVLKNALSTMETLDIISFSFISNKTKSLVMSMKLNSFVFRINIDISTLFKVELMIFEPWTFTLCQENEDGPVPLQMAHTVEVNHRRQVYNWRKEGYGVRDWIDHLMDITRQSNIFGIHFFDWGERFQLDSVKAALQGLNIKLLKICGEFTLPYLLDVVKSFPLKMLYLLLFHNSNPLELHSVFAQNLDAIGIVHMPGLGVNELVIMNTKFLEIQLGVGKQLTLFNSFLKLWKIGSNKSLEYLVFFSPRTTVNTIKDVVLKGIKHQVIPPRTVRYFKKPAGVDSPEATEVAEGGFDVQGIDGRNVTIAITNGLCRMFFWSV